MAREKGRGGRAGGGGGGRARTMRARRGGGAAGRLLLAAAAAAAALGAAAAREVPGGAAGAGPRAPPGPDASRSGLLPVPASHAGELFYWLFDSRGSPASDPLLVWLNGGPGCSSEMGALFENGPYRVSADGKLEPNEGSWTHAANVLFVDQPFGTGFSATRDPRDYARGEGAVSRDFLSFLGGFYDTFPEFSGRPLYISGESYGGHYVPAIAYAVLNGGDPRMNLKGLAIGNGLVDPETQYQAYPEFALSNGMISSSLRSKIDLALPECTKLIRDCNDSGARRLKRDADCLAAVAFCTAAVYEPITLAYEAKLGGPMNAYDIRETCQHFPMCYDLAPLQSFLNRKDVKAALGVPPHRPWLACSPAPYAALGVDAMANLAVHVPEMLARGLEVLVYAGEEDFICNWLGNYWWTLALDWAGKPEYVAAPLADWTDGQGGALLGQAKQANGLTFVKVAGAGHMVPFNQPHAALAMISNWLNGEPFSGPGPSSS